MANQNSRMGGKICGVPAETIKQLAADFSSKRTMLMGGWGMQRQRHGEQTHWMLVTLASMLGQIGFAGWWFRVSYHYSNGGVPTATGGIIGSITASPSGKAGAKHGWMIPLNPLSHWRVFQMCCSIQAKNSL